MLWTKAIEETVGFYTTVLGFTPTSFSRDFVTLTCGQISITFVVPQVDDVELANSPLFFWKPRLTGRILIETGDVVTLWLRLRDKVHVVSPLAEREYNKRDFSILDNNGYELVFGESVE